MDQPQKKQFSIKVNGVNVIVHNDLIVTLFLNVFHPEDDEIFDYWLGGSDFTKCKHNQTMAHAILNLNLDWEAIWSIKNDLAGLHLIYKAVKHSDVKALKILMRTFKTTWKYSDPINSPELEKAVEKHHYTDFLWNGEVRTPLEMATSMKNQEMIDLLT